MSKKKQRPVRERVTDLVSIYRRGRVWYVQYSQAGRRRRNSLETTYVAEAREKALDLDHKLRLGTLQTTEDIEVQALFDRYMQYLHNEGRRPNTIKRYRPVFRRFAALCDERRIRQATKVDIVLVEDYRGLRAKQGASEDTRYKETLWIKQVWKYAEERSLIPLNRIKSMKLKKPRARPQPCYTLAEVERILTVSAPNCRPAFAILAFSGMRVGELQWLAWRDVDFVNGMIHIRAKDGWLPKNGKDRSLPMSDRLRAVLETLPKKHRWVLAARRSDEYPEGGHQISTVHLLEKLKKVLAKVGIEVGGLHTFRHFFVTHCANQGVPPEVLMNWVGHSDLRMIVRYYSLKDEESRRAMSAVNFGGDFPRFGTVLTQLGGSEKQPRSQPPVFQVVTSAS